MAQLSTVQPEAVVRLEGVTKTYDAGAVQVQALRGVDIAIPPERFSMIIGPSGSGKTTLLNLIGCIDVPTSGKVHTSFGGRRSDYGGAPASRYSS